MKLCTDCKYYKAGKDEDYDTCTHERAATGGVRSVRWYQCIAMRAGICSDARLFVPKDPLAQPRPAEACSEVGHG